MTEEEWLACDDALQLPCEDALQLLAAIPRPFSARKTRLFTVACCHLFWPMLTDARSRNAVLVAERYADGEVSEEERVAASNASYAAFRECAGTNSSALDAHFAAHATVLHEVDNNYQFDNGLDATCHEIIYGVPPNKGGEMVLLLRDIFGNPFRPVAPDPRWLTSTAVALADGIYADRAFDRLPILADALEEAGCDSAEVLAHCRGDGPHARGCWVVDLVLGKS